MKKNDPEISVLLPFHSYAEKLDQAIKSIIHQTFENWELILVNNNADINAIEIAQNHTCIDKRIKLVHEKKQGIAHALNKGLTMIKSGVVARMDSDDISYPDRLRLQYIYLTENHQVDVVACQCLTLENPSNPNEGYRHFVEWQNGIISNQDHYNNRFVESPIAHPSVMFRKKLIDKYGFYNTDSIPEDYELWLRWMDSGVQFYKIPEVLIEWNDGSDRISRTNPDYSKEAFYKVKSTYLINHLIKNGIAENKKIIICGTSTDIRKKAAKLIDSGIPVFGYTDVRQRYLNDINFIPFHSILDAKDYCLINLIEKRGVGIQIRQYFQQFGFIPGENLILAG